MEKTERLSVAEYVASKGVKRHKYAASAVVHDGKRFDSKLERDRYIHWSNMWRAGGIQYFIRQVPFELPGGIVYRLDFMIVGIIVGIDPNPPIYEDCKGFLTRVSANKIKQVEEIYRIKIDLITKRDLR